METPVSKDGTASGSTPKPPRPVKAIEKGVEIEIKMEMSKTADHGAITFTPEGKSTRVTWTDAGDMGMNPGGRWFAFLFMDKMLGKMFEDGLTAMKAKAEGK